MWVVKQFPWNFSGQWYMVFCLFLWSPRMNRAHLVWFERSLHPAQVSAQSCPWPLKLITTQVVEGTWIRMGGYWRLRSEWLLPREDKGDREGIPHTHPIPYVIRLELVLESG